MLTAIELGVAASDRGAPIVFPFASSTVKVLLVELITKTLPFVGLTTNAFGSESGTLAITESFAPSRTSNELNVRK